MIVNKFIPTLFVLLVASGMLTAAYFGHQKNAAILSVKERCDAGGWTWLSQEGKCIMVKELK